MRGWWMVWAALALLASIGAFLVLDPVLAAFVAIVLVTIAGLAFLARDWDRHTTFEQRELERARRRQEKWERGTAARERDRVRWEAHQARQRAKQEGRTPEQQGG